MTFDQFVQGYIAVTAFYAGICWGNVYCDVSGFKQTSLAILACLITALVWPYFFVCGVFGSIKYLVRKDR